jgi:cytochrome c556
VLQDSESTAADLVAALADADRPLSSQTMELLEQSCKQCHQQWRDR